MSEKFSAPVAAVAAINENVGQNAGQLTTVPKILSHSAKGAAKNRMTDQEQRERQIAGEKYRRDSGTFQR